MAGEKFKLPASSYEELTKIIKAYGPFDAPSDLSQVSKLIGIDATVISRNVGFLLELAILEPGKKKSLTTVGRNLSQALEHEMPDEIRQNWREIVNETEFLSKLITAIKIRNGMDESTLQSHIAFSAGQPKKPQFMTGARTVVDILRASELIREQDGKIVVAKIEDGDSVTRNSASVDSYASRPTRSNPDSLASAPTPIIERVDSGRAQINININITVNCSTADLDTLGEKLNSVIEDINRDVNSEQNDVDE